MKVLYLADIRFPMERANGIQTIETCHALARAGVDVDLVVRRSDSRPDSSCLEFYGLPPHPRLKLRRLGVPRAGSALGKVVFTARCLPFVLRERYDVIYTRDLALSDLAVRSRFLHRLPLVYEAHTSAATFAVEAPHLYENASPPSRRKVARLRRREIRVYRRSSGLITITRELKNFLEKGYGPLAPVYVVPDGARVSETRPPARSRLPDEPFRVTYIGQLYPWKGVDTLIEAMTKLPKQELVIIGGLPPEPDLERTRKLAENLSVSERVRFRGFVPPTELDQERALADVFVIPLQESVTARFFTSPLKLFEAMAAARPIVASDMPSIREVLTHEVNALLVPPGDADALAAALGRLAEDQELGERLIENSLKDVRRYSWDERGIRLARLLHELLIEPPVHDE